MKHDLGRETKQIYAVIWLVVNPMPQVYAKIMTNVSRSKRRSCYWTLMIN